MGMHRPLAVGMHRKRPQAAVGMHRSVGTHRPHQGFSVLASLHKTEKGGSWVLIQKHERKKGNLRKLAQRGGLQSHGSAPEDSGSHGPSRPVAVPQPEMVSTGQPGSLMPGQPPRWAEAPPDGKWALVPCQSPCHGHRLCPCPSLFPFH